MKKLLSFILFAGTVFASYGQTTKIPNSVKENIQKRVAYGDNVGITIGLINGKQVDYFSVGKTALSGGSDINVQSVFEIGSISKVFTTTLLADEVLKGNMSLDDPIEMHLPKKVKVPSKNGQKITLRDLATHSSALPRMPDNFDPADPGDPFADYGPDRLYDFLSNYQLTRGIGERYEYSNYAMGLLGHILELKTGKSYEQLVIERIAQPYQMNNTTVVLTDVQKKQLALGHSGTQEMKNWGFQALAGAGAIKSTMDDMVKFVQANLAPDQSPIGKAMQMSHQTAYKTKAQDFEMGLGWHYAAMENQKIIWHNGQTGGYHSFAGFIEGTDRGVVVLSNSTTNIDDIGLHLLDNSRQLLEPVKKEKKKEIKVAEEILETYVGNYAFNPQVAMKITREKQQLFLQLTGQQRFPAFASSERDFFVKVVEASITFNVDKDGKVESLTLHQGGRDQIAKRTNGSTVTAPKKERKEITVPEETLAKYVGKYQLSPAFHIQITQEGPQLFLQATGQQQLKIYPFAQNEFFLKVVDAQVTFKEGAEDQIESLVLHQNGQNIPGKKVE